MGLQIVSVTDGIITLKVSGKLSHPELSAVQRTAAGILRQYGKMAFLVLGDNFEGWEREGDWGDLSFMSNYDQYMEKMALVGDKKWKDLVLVFTGKGLRHCQVEYFQPEEVDKARAWLVEKT